MALVYSKTADDGVGHGRKVAGTASLKFSRFFPNRHDYFYPTPMSRTRYWHDGNGTPLAAKLMNTFQAVATCFSCTHSTRGPRLQNQTL
jgi:hypothetical protein